MINFQVNQMCIFQQNKCVSIFKIICASNLQCTLYIVFIKHTFFKHHSKWIKTYSKNKIKCYVAHSIFMKMQPCLCLYQNICFLFGEIFQIM